MRLLLVSTPQIICGCRDWQVSETELVAGKLTCCGWILIIVESTKKVLSMWYCDMSNSDCFENFCFFCFQCFLLSFFFVFYENLSMCSGVYIIGSYQRQNQSYKVISGILNSFYRCYRLVSVYFQVFFLSVSCRESLFPDCFRVLNCFRLIFRFWHAGLMWYAVELWVRTL